jgi:DNA-binding NtrC family response regulator
MPDYPEPTAAFSARTEQPISSAILFVSPVRPDQSALRRILRRTNRTISAATCRHAFKRLSRTRVPVVLCDSDLLDGKWLDVLNHVAASDNPPLLIVTSRVADDRLWAEVLNLGGFDVIAKPFVASEVLHVLRTAAMQWQLRQLRGSDKRRLFSASAGA